MGKQEAILGYGKIEDLELEARLAKLLAESKVEQRPRHYLMKYYPLAGERQKYFPMETPEESAGMGWFATSQPRSGREEKRRHENDNSLINR